MANIFLIEGFDAYATVADMAAAGKWTFSNVAAASLVPGRLGGQCLQSTDRFGFSGLSKMMPYQHAITGFAYKWPGGPKAIYKAMSYGGEPVVQVLANPGGYLTVEVYRGGLFPIMSSVRTINPDTWNYIEVELKWVSQGIGQIKVWLNGEEVMAGDANCEGQGPEWVRTILMGDQDGLIDDIYMAEGGAGVLPLGDVRIEAFLPTSTETLTGFTVTGAATAHEAMADGSDATFIEGSASGDKALFDTTDVLSQTPKAVIAVGLTFKGSKSDAGIRTLKGILKIGAAEYQSSDTMYLPPTISSMQTVWRNNPATGGAWTRAAVEALRFGVVIDQ